MSNGHRFQKGKSGNPKGRAKGSKNKIPVEVRAAIQQALEQRAESIGQCLDRVKRKSPASFLQAYKEFLEYVIPKLARTEVTGEGGGPIKSSVHMYIPENDRRAR